MSKQNQSAHHHGGGNQGHHQNTYRQNNSGGGGGNQGSNSGNQYSGGGGHHGGGGQYHGGGRGGGSYQSGSGSRNKNNQSHRQHQNQNYQHYGGHNSQNMGGGPQGSNQMMNSYSNYMSDNQYDNDGLSKSQGQSNKNDRQDRSGNINSGVYGPYQNMPQQNNMMSSYGQPHHSQNSYGGGNQSQKYKNRENRHERNNNQGGGSQHSYHKSSYNQGGHYYQGNQMPSSATPRNQMHSYHNDFSGGGQYTDNQSEAYGDENESSSDKRYNNSNQKSITNDSYGNQMSGSMSGNQNSQGTGRNKGGSGMYQNYDQKQSHDQHDGKMGMQQDQGKQNKMGHGGGGQRNDQSHYQMQKGDGVKRGQQQNSGNTQSQQYSRSGVHATEKKHINNSNNNFGVGGQQSDQHLSTGSPTNSYNGESGMNERNRGANQRRTSENQQNSFMNDRNSMRGDFEVHEGNKRMSNKGTADRGGGADRTNNYQQDQQNEFQQMGTNQSMQGFGNQMGSSGGGSYYGQGNMRGDFAVHQNNNSMHGGNKGNMHKQGGDYQQHQNNSNQQSYNNNNNAPGMQHMGQRSQGHIGNSQGKHGRGQGMNQQQPMHQMGGQGSNVGHAPNQHQTNKKGNYNQRYNTEQQDGGFQQYDKKQQNQQAYGGGGYYQQNPQQKNKKNKGNNNMNSGMTYQNDSHDEFYGDSSNNYHGNQQHYGSSLDTDSKSYKQGKKHQSQIVGSGDNRSDLNFQGHPMMSSEQQPPYNSMSGNEKGADYGGNNDGMSNNNNRMGGKHRNDQESVTNHFVNNSLQINNYGKSMHYGQMPPSDQTHQTNNPMQQDDNQNMSSFYPQNMNPQGQQQPQAQFNPNPAGYNLNSQATQFGNNNVFVQQNFNTQVYIPDNHYYPKNLSAPGGYDVSNDLSAMTSVQGQPQVPNPLKDIIGQTSQQKSFDGNREHTEEGRPKEVLVEIDVKLITGEMENIKITEAKNASSPLNFFDIQLQIKDRLKQLKNQLLIPTSSQKKSGHEQQKEKHGSNEKTDGKQGDSSGEKKKDEKAKDEQVQASKPPQLMTREEKEQEKMYQDLIEALEFFVKRQLQHNLMPKYKEIAKNTHKIQFEQSIKKLQNDQFYGNPHQLTSFANMAQANPAYQMLAQNPQLQVADQTLLSGQSLAPVNHQAHLMTPQYPQLNPHIGRAYTPVENQLSSYSLNQQAQSLTPNQLSENQDAASATRLFDQLNMTPQQIQQFQNAQQRPQLFNSQNMLYPSPADQFGNHQQQIDYGKMLMGAASQQSQRDLTGDNQQVNAADPQQQQQQQFQYPSLASKEFHPKRGGGQSAAHLAPNSTSPDTNAEPQQQYGSSKK